jgi:hypothetical protein
LLSDMDTRGAYSYTQRHSHVLPRVRAIAFGPVQPRVDYARCDYRNDGTSDPRILASKI